jgi:hypothetical protein
MFRTVASKSAKREKVKKKLEAERKKKFSD